MNEYIKNISVKDFTQLKVWRKSFDICNDIYRITCKFPKFEEYALKSQIIRSCTSICGNICEGNSQLYKKKEINFLNNALGSASETRNWLMLALQQEYITQEDFDKLDERFIEIIKMLIGCIKKIQSDLSNDVIISEPEE
jgi:four helix bundle protein